jgi:hypothetical protein
MTIFPCASFFEVADSFGNLAQRIAGVVDLGD